jgi:hypothetical protein
LKVSGDKIKKGNSVIQLIVGAADNAKNNTFYCPFAIDFTASQIKKGIH